MTWRKNLSNSVTCISRAPSGQEEKSGQGITVAAIKGPIQTLKSSREDRGVLLLDCETSERPPEPCWEACSRGNLNMRDWKRNLRSDLKACWCRRKTLDTNMSDLEVRLFIHLIYRAPLLGYVYSGASVSYIRYLCLARTSSDQCLMEGLILQWMKSLSFKLLIIFLIIRLICISLLSKRGN